MSPFNYESSARLQRFTPKIGETLVIHIRDSKRVDDPTRTDEKNFRSRTENFGWRHEATLTDGRLFIVNTFKLWEEFNKAGVDDGDLVQIEHIAKGSYKVTVLEKGTGLGIVVPDLEKEQYLASKRASQAPAPAQTVTQSPATVAPVATPAPVAQPVQATPPAAVAPAVAPVVQPEEELDLPF